MNTVKLFINAARMINNAININTKVMEKCFLYLKNIINITIIHSEYEINTFVWENHQNDVHSKFDIHVAIHIHINHSSKTQNNFKSYHTILNKLHSLCMACQTLQNWMFPYLCGTLQHRYFEVVGTVNKTSD